MLQLQFGGGVRKPTGGPVIVDALICEGVLTIVGVPVHDALGHSDVRSRQVSIRAPTMRHECCSLNRLPRQACSDPDEVHSALERAFEAKAPAVMEVMVERGCPMSGSPAVG